MIDRIFTRIEEAILCGPNWATRSTTFGKRLLFYRDTAMWPGIHSQGVTEMVTQGDINAERNAGKVFCAEQKLRRALDVGLDIK